MDPVNLRACQQAAKAIRHADSLLICAGAGIGVDSGLPDFRGNEGFWRAYPPFRKRGLSFVDAANPKWFFERPHQAWGFYGHRYLLYSRTMPHQGFSILKNWCEQKLADCFVFTSNVDGHFQKAGFEPEKILECHGSINHWQCSTPCNNRIAALDEFELEVDPETFLAIDPLPTCPICSEPARPNVLMFGDGQWIETRTALQERRYRQWWQQANKGNVVTIELGAGTAVPTVRWEAESSGRQLIRINPRESEVPAGGISISTGSKDALVKINEFLTDGDG